MDLKLDKLRIWACLPFRLVMYMVAGIKKLASLTGRGLRPLLGRLSWQAPTWLKAIGQRISKLWQMCVNHQARASMAILLALCLAAGAVLIAHWYNTRPIPAHVTFRVNAPALTNYHGKEPQPQNLSINFHSSVAPLELSGKQLPPGLVEVQPMHPGTWRYASDRRLIFTPSHDWPAGREYKIRWLADKIFASHVLVDKSVPSFTTAVFSGSISQRSFEQDQQDPNIRKAVFRLNFSHPVDMASLQKRISLEQLVTGSPSQEIKFTLSPDDKLLNVYIVSDNIKLQEQGSQINLKLDKGVMPVVGGTAFANELSASVNVPSIYGLAINSLQPLLVDDEDYNTDQLISLQFNQRVSDDQARRAIQAYVLPKYKTQQEERNRQPHNWSTSEVDDKVLGLSIPLNLAHLENQEQYTPAHNFKYQAQPGEYVLVKVSGGLEAFGGYLLAKDYFNVVRVPNYVPSLSLAGNGSLLALSGEQRVTIVGRNLDNAYLELARLQPEQLHHLAALNNGSFMNPSLYLSPDNITDRFETSVPFINQPVPQYKGVDLSPWLKDKNRLGIFLLRLSNNKDTLRYDSRDYRTSGNSHDARLIVVSDLGLLLKQEQAGGTHVFVQSIHTGQPVNGAMVQLIAVNGKVLKEQVTDAQGHVFFAKLDNYVRELKPIMFLAQKGSDTNFLPLGGQQVRFLNYSRFDVGGESTPLDKGKLRAHMFSDRGLYRPGDTINLGAIVRDYGWEKELDGLPAMIMLTDSRGRNVMTRQIKLNHDGFVEASHTTELTSPTGTWNAGIYLVEKNRGNTLLGSVRVQVQEFEPDTMKVKARLNKQKEQGWVSPEDIEALVSVENLFGTPAQNRRVEATISLQPAFPRFDRYPGYVFHDPSKNPRSWQEQLGSVFSDEKGQAVFKLNLSAFAGASFQLTFMARAYAAQGGRDVSAMTTTLVSPNPYLVGSKADGGLSFINRQAIRNINFIAVNPDLKPVQADGLKLSLIEHKYVSVLTRQGSGLYKYESKEKQDNLWERDFTIPASGLDYPLPSDKPGRYSLIVTNSDGQQLNKVEFSIAGAGNVTRSLERNAELEVTLNKSSYAPEEEIKLSLRAPYTGSGLITIERDKVYSHTWFKADTTSSVQTITVPQGIEGNAYVNVQFIRDPGSDEVFMSPLSYAVVPFNINRDQRTLPFTMQAPDLVKPGEELAIKLSSPYKATFVVFAVDEGILQVARYSLANPLQTFFTKQALQVNTTQLLDMILPEFQKLLNMSAPGGGMAEMSASARMIAENLNPFQRIRDLPVVYWSGLVEVDGEKTLTWQAPDYFNGSLRIMAVAVNRDMIGTAQRQCLVRGDFVLSPSLPYTVAPGDEFIMSLGVSNNLPGEQSIPIDITLQLSENLQIAGDAKQTLELKPGHEGYVLFKLKATDIPGAATITPTATWQDKHSARTMGISVRPATPFTTTIKTGMLEDRQIQIDRLRSMYDQFASRSIWAGFTPVVLMQGLSGFLSYYPYQCSEQLTSQAYGGLVMSRHPALAELLDNKVGVDKINKVIATLQNRQNSSGVIGAYSAAVNEEPFVTPYVVQFLLEAKAQGISVPQNMLDSANAYLRNLADNKSLSQLEGLRMRCFAIYLLTRQGVLTTSYIAKVQETLNRYYKDIWGNDLCAAYLACAFKLMKQDVEAKRLMETMWKNVHQSPQTDDWQGLYDSLARHAIVLYLGMLHFPELKVGSQAIDNLGKPLAEGRFNTISAAMALLALDGYAKQIAPQTSGGLSLTQVIPPDKHEPVAGTSQGLLVSGYSGQATALLLDNHTQLPAWYSLLQAGYENRLPAAASNNGLEILREYYDREGKPLIQATLGQEVVVRLKIRATQQSYIDNLVVVELLPGGFEIVRNASQPKGNWQPYYVDNREDRVVLYGGISRDISEYVYVMKATSRGEFIVPPAYAESMYLRGINANSAPGTTLQVVDALD